MTIKTQVTFFMPGRKSLKAVRLLCLSSAAMTLQHGKIFTGAALYNIAGSLTWGNAPVAFTLYAQMRMRKSSEPHL